MLRCVMPAAGRWLRRVLVVACACRRRACGSCFQGVPRRASLAPALSQTPAVQIHGMVWYGVADPCCAPFLSHCGYGCQ